MEWNEYQNTAIVNGETKWNNGPLKKLQLTDIVRHVIAA